MTKLQKGPEPNVLAQNKTAWTAQLLAHIQNNQPVPKTLANRYNHQDVKGALRSETNSKCMYCESPVLHITFEHIEHIKPKAKDKYPELTFEWANLGLACPTCNMNKSDTYSQSSPFINPYIDDPIKHFVSLGPFVYHKPGDHRADLTETTIALNRPELIERRQERIDMIRLLADKIATINDSTLQKNIKYQLSIELQSDKPYSFCAKSAFEHLCN